MKAYNFKVITDVETEPVLLPEAKLHCKVDDVADDDILTILITAARETAEQYCGRALASRTLEAVLDEFPPCDDDAIDLPMPPVASVTHIKYTDTDGVEQTVDSGDYSLSTYGESRTINLAYDTEWPETRCIPNAVRVRYVTGYETCPKAAVNAILLMVGFLYANRGDAIKMDAENIQPPAARALLDTIKVYGR